MVGREFPMEGKIFYDSYGIESRINPRKLTNVYFNYTGLTMDDAHNSLADVEATIEVFKNQLKVLGEDNESGIPIEEWTENRLYSPEGSIRNAAMVGGKEMLVFNFGKYKDREFMEVCRIDPNYISWFKDKVASPYTWRLLTKYYKKFNNKNQNQN